MILHTALVVIVWGCDLTLYIIVTHDPTLCVKLLQETLPDVLKSRSIT